MKQDNPFMPRTETCYSCGVEMTGIDFEFYTITSDFETLYYCEKCGKKRARKIKMKFALKKLRS